jgi:hypothetical protein
MALILMGDWCNIEKDRNNGNSSDADDWKQQGLKKTFFWGTFLPLTAAF